MSPEQRLFKAVVTQCVIDAVAEPEALPSREEWIAKRKVVQAARGQVKSDIALYGAWKHAQKGHKSRLMQFHAMQATARAWLLDAGRDMQLICGLAGIDPDYIRSSAQKLAQANWKPATPVRRYAAAIAA